MNAVAMSIALTLTEEPTRPNRDAEQLSEVKLARREQRGHSLRRLLTR